MLRRIFKSTTIKKDDYLESHVSVAEGLKKEALGELQFNPGEEYGILFNVEEMESTDEVLVGVTLLCRRMNEGL